ncbi:MAG TPA: hypothetical protein VME63_05610 [Dyella sp.]|uniref:hypothetical protein n=1 Tax=Dyella sp. TaxID=1869338 RepID=UPI002C3CBD90|nr:hypothetical protein [Dyella sp.]HTV84859.1 hypothetical protein [Dyella sp.]
MMQRQVTHASGSFAACADCKKEPRHFTAHGSAKHEDPLFAAWAERHQLECVCARRTGWCNTLADAVRVWNELGDTLPAAAQAGGNVLPIRLHRPT